jgi:RsiW-degrading membrane proteinase PrsW (M82 family)
MVLAVVPLVGVLFAVRIVDRWEPEPRGLLILAIAWGAIAAVGIALGVDLLLSMVFGPATGAREVLQTVVQAPVVEEFAKGLGVFLIFATARRAFDGPIDGIVYGALVGAGFAFTENIQYFAVSFIEGGATETTTTFFLRGILSPFAHVMFTSVTGFALGLAARRGLSTGQAIGPGLLGLAGAIALHAFWNGSAMFGDFFFLYLTLQVPLFIGFILGVVALRREESRLTRRRLGEYAAAGWFTPQEVDMLATSAGRKAALAWARTLRGDRTPLMKTFITDATALAATRQRAITGRDPQAAAEERDLLAKTAATRAAMFAP